MSRMFPRLVLQHSGTAQVLKPFPLVSDARGEDWLRNLLFDHPETLPAAEIDPAFADPVPICKELAVESGRIDALYINRQGAIVMVECKLWRNPQARREVVAQALDYATHLARMRYEDLERAVAQRLGGMGRPNELFRRVAERNPGLDEAGFVDAVGRNLRRGRFLVVLAGDGIRVGTEAIVSFIESHAGLRLSFGLVEMAGFSLPDGSLLIQPRLTGRLVTREREMIRVLDTDGSDLPVRDVEVAAEAPVDDGMRARQRVDPAFLEADRQFWARLARTIRFDDPTQAPPVRFGVGNVRYLMDIPGVKLAAWRSRPGAKMSTYIQFRGEQALRLFEELEAQRESITSELQAAAPGSTVEWDSGLPDEQWVALRKPIPGVWDAQSEEQQVAWFAAAGNAFVNSFKPRLHQLLAQQGGARFE